MLSDQELVEKILSGNRQSYSYLVNKYRNMVFSICYRIVENRGDAEDLSQEVFVKAYFSLKKLKDQNKFSSWIYKIAYYNSISKVRQSKLKKSDIENIENYTDKQLYDEENLSDFDRKERKLIIKKAIKQLNSDERILIHLYYYVDCSIEEISYITNQTKDYIKLKLYRTRQKLGKLLKPQMVEN